VENGEEQDFGLDEEEPIVVPLPELEVPRNIIEELSKFIAQHIEKEDDMNRRVRDYLDELYEQFDDDEEVSDFIMNYVQRRHGWDLEIVLSESDVEEMFFKVFDGYDPEMWGKVRNTDAVRELHYEVYKLSQFYAKKAVNEVLQDKHPTRKKRRKFW
jgi:hypothetical protein